MASAAVRDFCIAAKEVVAIKEAARTRSKSVLEQKKSAHAVLEELLTGCSPGDATGGYLATTCNGSTYRVRLRPKTCTTPPKNAEAAAERVLELWNNQDALTDLLAQSGSMDPSSVLVDYILSHTSKINQKTQVLEVTPYRPKAEQEIENAPRPAPAGSGIEELLSSYVLAKEEASSILRECKEKRKNLEERWSDAEERLIGELDALPADKKIQKVNLRDSDGHAESYYLRVKPARKQSAKSLLGIKSYRAVLKSAVDDVITRFCADPFRAPSIVPRIEFGQALSDSLRRLVDELVTSKTAEATALAATAPRRVALDRVRTRTRDQGTKKKFTMTSESILSSTDAKIFKRLANQDVVDVELIPESSAKESQRKATQQMKAAIEKAATSKVGTASPSCNSSQNTSALRTAMKAAAATSQDDNSSSEDDEKTQRPPPPNVPPPPAPSSTAKISSASQKSSLTSPTTTAATKRSQPEPILHSATKDHDDSESSDAESTKPPPKKKGKSTKSSSGNNEDERLEKQGLLIELRRMEARGIQLSRRFDEDDTLEELEFEVVRQNSAASTDSAVSFAREMLRFGLVGIEMANKRLGPFLSLDGWSDSVCTDMHKYDHALERLYKQYWRKHQVSPVLEIGGIIIGSMVMWHFKSTLFGPPTNGSRQASSSSSTATSSGSQQQHHYQNSAPQTSGGVAGNFNRRVPTPSAQPHVPPSSQQTSNNASGRRPVLRPPTALFGRL